MAGFVGQQFGNYKLERILGRGAFADVYLGRHIGNNNDEVAVKVLHDQLSEEGRANFENEASMLLKLRHPNIVHLRDYGIRQDGVSYLIMDYAPNGSMDEKYPAGKRLSLPEVIAYVKQAAEALRYAHAEKVIHCDIKPANILLGSKNEIVLGDFGIAIIAQNTRAMKTGDPIGTIEFMSPEQILGRPRPASDQYSLAIVVYLWLTGTLPFNGSYGVILMQQWKEAPPPLRSIVSSLPVAVEKVVLKALSKETKDRYANIQGFADALEAAASPEAAIQPGKPMKPSASTPPVQPFPPVSPASPVPRVARNPSPQPNDPPLRPLVPPPTGRPPANRASIAESVQQLVKNGNASWHHGKYEDAIRAYDEAIRKAPEYIEAYNQRGKAKNALWHYQEAIKDFDRAISLDPGYNWAYSNRGLAYLNLGLMQFKRKEEQQAIQKLELAIADYEKAIELELKDRKTFQYCGLAHQKLGQLGPINRKIEHFVRAIDNYDHALGMDRNYVQARHNRNMVYDFLNRR